MGCWLLLIEPVHCGSNRILKVRFLGTLYIRAKKQKQNKYRNHKYYKIKTDNISNNETVENWKLLLYMSFHVRLSVNKKQTYKTTAKAAKQFPLRYKTVFN